MGMPRNISGRDRPVRDRGAYFTLLRDGNLDMKSTSSASKKRTTTVVSVKRKSASKRGRPAQREAALEVLKKFRQVFRAAKLHFSAVEKRAGVGRYASSMSNPACA
jgi:hypothetical protein